MEILTESAVDMERIVEVLKCVGEDNPNNVYDLAYTEDGRTIRIEWIKELEDD